MLKVLVADDDDALRYFVKSTLSSTGKFDVDVAADGQFAVDKVASEKFDVVILDVDMPRKNGLEALKEIKELDPGMSVIMLTAHGKIDDAVQAVKDGAYNYVSKPIEAESLIEIVHRAIHAHTMISNIAASSPILMEAGRKIIGHTDQMKKVFNIVNRLSKVDTPVLIRGASGTGKELVARAIHYNSARKDEKFVAINCSAIPENLFESELFGHEKGSFTGADARKIGKFQFAEGGTLFLDELGDMPVLMQVKLLRVLQEKLFTPVGANRELPTNVRIIAATNRPLEEMIKAGTFREDLFYRLNVIPIFLPALAERKNDIESLVSMFIKKFNQEHGRKITAVAPDALSVLKKYEWPGNIRELENVIEHSFILSNSSQIELCCLPESLLIATGIELSEIPAEPELEETFIASDSAGSDSADGSDAATIEDTDSGDFIKISTENLDFNAQKEKFEKEFIIKALQTFNGRINQTALHANIPKKTLLRKIEKYGIVARDYTE